VADTLQDVMLKVENPTTGSVYKTNLVVEARDLDPQNPPTLQEFVDRRVTQKGSLTGYHFISEQDDTVDAQKARQIVYTYVVQPIDQPRRVALPVVVVAREGSSSAKTALLPHRRCAGKSSPRPVRSWTAF
jgi:hypothetical protein